MTQRVLIIRHHKKSQENLINEAKVKAYHCAKIQRGSNERTNLSLNITHTSLGKKIASIHVGKHSALIIMQLFQVLYNAIICRLYSYALEKYCFLSSVHVYFFSNQRSARRIPVAKIARANFLLWSSRIDDKDPSGGILRLPIRFYFHEASSLSHRGLDVHRGKDHGFRHMEELIWSIWKLLYYYLLLSESFIGAFALYRELRCFSFLFQCEIRIYNGACWCYVCINAFFEVVIYFIVTLMLWMGKFHP